MGNGTTMISRRRVLAAGVALPLVVARKARALQVISPSGHPEGRVAEAAAFPTEASCPERRP